MITSELLKNFAACTEPECSILCLWNSISEHYPEPVRPVHILDLLFKIHFNIMLPYGPLKRSFPMVLFNTKFYVYFSRSSSYQMLYGPKITFQNNYWIHPILSPEKSERGPCHKNCADNYYSKRYWRSSLWKWIIKKYRAFHNVLRDYKHL